MSNSTSLLKILKSLGEIMHTFEKSFVGKKR